MAGFGLPPGVHDRATVVADDFAIPHPGFGIDWLANRAKKAQTIELMLLWPLVSPSQKCADCCWGGIKNIYFVTINNSPEAIRLRKIRSAFVHETSGAVK